MPPTTRTAVLNPTPLAITLIDGTTRTQDHVALTFWQDGSSAGGFYGNSFQSNLGIHVQSNRNSSAHSWEDIISIRGWGMQKDEYTQLYSGVEPDTNDRYLFNTCYTNGKFHFAAMNGDDPVTPSTFNLCYYEMSMAAFGTGGNATPALPTKNTHVLDFGAAIAQFDYYDNNFPLAQSTGANPASGTIIIPVWDVPNAQDDVAFVAVQNNSGMTLHGAWKWDVPTDYGLSIDVNTLANCNDGTFNYTFATHNHEFRMIKWRPSSAAGIPSDYEMWIPDFDDSNITDMIPGRNYNSFVGTPFGFILSWQGPIGPPPYTFYAILIALDWSSYRYIDMSFTGAVGQAIFDGGSGNPPTTYPALMLGEDGTYYLKASTQSLTPEIRFAYTDDGDDGDPVPDDGGPRTDNRRLRAWTFSLDGHDFYVLRLGMIETLVCDITTGAWMRWNDPDDDVWRATSGWNWIGMDRATFTTDVTSQIVAGDDTLGLLWTLDPAAGYDEDVSVVPLARLFERIVTGGVLARSRDRTSVGAAQLTATTGRPLTGGADITLETSDDGGESWTSHGTVTVTTDDFKTPLEWRALGQMQAPGRLYRITDSGAVFTIEGLDTR